MPSPTLRPLVSCALAALILLAAGGTAAAQGSVTPSFGGGTLTLVGEGYRAGERVELTVRAGGASHQLTATADTRGRFRLDTGLAVPPLSSLEIEARDEQGLTQVTITSTPGALPGTEGGPAECVPDEILVKFQPEADPSAVSARHGATIKSAIAALEVYVLSIPAGTVAETVAELSADPDVEYAEPNGIARAVGGPGAGPCGP